MRVFPQIRAQSGSSIIEVVLSISTVAIVGMALMGSFTYGFHIMGLVRENQRATQIILEKVETVRLYSWDQLLTPGFVPPTFTEHYDPQAADGEQGVAYFGTVTVTNFTRATSYQDNVRQLVITLNWTTSGNLRRSRQLATLVAKNGIQNYVY
jgi:hypothetical protein